MSSRGISFVQDDDRARHRSIVPVMPYPMHPATLRYLADTDLLSLRGRASHRQAILFAGSQKTRYGDQWMQREFDVLSRLEALDTLREFLSKPDPRVASAERRVADRSSYWIADRMRFPPHNGSPPLPPPASSSVAPAAASPFATT